MGKKLGASRFYSDQIALAAVAVCALLCVTGCKPAQTTSTQPPNKNIVFWGVVVDEHGRGIPNAEVKGLTAPLTMGAITPSAIPDRPGQSFAVLSGADGRFIVQVPPKHLWLEILAVNRTGFDWVVDYAWVDQKLTHFDNRGFCFSPEGSDFQYRPEKDRPAMILMHTTGAPAPHGTLSRGGSDKVDGRWLQNPVGQPHIPSAGPGAPRNNDEIGDRIDQYFKNRGGGQ